MLFHQWGETWLNRSQLRQEEHNLQLQAWPFNTKSFIFISKDHDGMFTITEEMANDWEHVQHGPPLSRSPLLCALTYLITSSMPPYASQSSRLLREE